jgi:hypothetical protein
MSLDNIEISGHALVLLQASQQRLLAENGD